MSVAKANHKHDYQPCVFEYEGIRYYKNHAQKDKTDVSIGTYCPICGKVGGVNDYERWMTWIQDRDCRCGHYEYTAEARKEIDPETRTFPTFFLDDMLFQKYVSVESGDGS